MKKLAVLGASGHGKVVADIAECSGWHSVVFFDDAWPAKQTNGAWAIHGNFESMVRQLSDFDGVVVAIGDNQIRHTKLAELAILGGVLQTLIHPSAVISRYASIGPGGVVCAGVQVNADTHIGSGVILNTGCSVDHDCHLGNSVHVSPGARLGGGVRVGDLSWIGIGAAVRHLSSIGKRAIVGAGAAVVNDIGDDAVVVGVPAKGMK